MTYITYVKMQYSDYKIERTIYNIGLTDGQVQRRSGLEGIYRHRQPPKKMPPILPKPDFMPSYLVRTSDMKLVQGSTVHEGYCALSYSWNQSGEIIKNKTTKDSHRIDQGKHKIIFPGKTVRKKPRGRKRIPRKVKFVTFEGLIQEICKDFNIKYIWYDQMCIDQEDETKKHDEIYQMHKIYSNAYCTMALVPELTINIWKPSIPKTLHATLLNRRSLRESQWMTRLWTLEETIMSSKMLFVGHNAHCWWYRLDQNYFPIFRKEFDFNVAIILHYAHIRISTKERDRIFALANIFPDTMKQLTINSKQDIQELIIQFYGLLAKKDLSILCFEKYTYDGYLSMSKTAYSNNINDSSIREAGDHIPIQKFDLPSWAGVHGQHLKTEMYKTSFKNYTVIGRALQLTCSGVTNDQHQTEILDLESIAPKDILPPFPQQSSDHFWTLVISIRSPGSRNEKLIEVYTVWEEPTELCSTDYKKIIGELCNLSHFFQIKNKNLQWIPNSDKFKRTKLDFRNMVEALEDSDQYVLLTGVPFTNPNDKEYIYYPVIKKNGDYYKAIGLCWAQCGNHVFDDTTSEEQMFEIH